MLECHFKLWKCNKNPDKNTFKSVEEWVDSKTLSVNILIKSCMQ